MSLYVTRKKKASGGYRSLHPEAQKLLEEMREKEHELLQAIEQEEVRKKEAEKKGFLGKGTWGDLDGLKF